MPELPDVERFRRVFAEHATGRRIRAVVTTDPAIVRNATPEALEAALTGARFDEPERRGKWLLAWTGGPAMLLHFGMTGDVIPAADAAGRHPHDRVVVVLDRGEVRYRNMRKFGGVWLAHDRREAERILSGLGPDAMSIDRRSFVSLLRGRRGRVKAALMDQRLLSGVGNLVADEVLWHARIHPAGRLADLADRDLARLHGRLRAVLERWVEGYGRLPRGWLIRTRGPGGACPRCGRPLERSTVGGRTTYHCPVCQPAGPA